MPVTTAARLRALVLSVLVVVLAAGLGPVTLAAGGKAPMEDLASYQPESRCSPKDKAGAKYLADWLVRNYGGHRGRIGASCTPSVSEHQEGRAIDWSMDATSKRDSKRVEKFLTWAFAEDHRGRVAAKARRMGIMYVIWDDEMYSAWREFEPTPYLSSSCKKLKKCSPSLRHRDHVHVSLTRKGGYGKTSWYAGRLKK